MLEQRSLQHIVVVEDFTVLFQIAAAHTPVFAYLIFAVIRQSNVGNEIIAHLTVCTVFCLFTVFFDICHKTVEITLICPVLQNTEFFKVFASRMFQSPKTT